MKKFNCITNGKIFEITAENIEEAKIKLLRIFDEDEFEILDEEEATRSDIAYQQFMKEAIHMPFNELLDQVKLNQEPMKQYILLDVLLKRVLTRYAEEKNIPVIDVITGTTHEDNMIFFLKELTDNIF